MAYFYERNYTMFESTKLCTRNKNKNFHQKTIAFFNRMRIIKMSQ